jgi:hypothetical protein
MRILKMPHDQATTKLLEALDIKPRRDDRAELAPGSRRALSATLGDQDGFGLETVAELKRILRNDPGRMLAAAPALLGTNPTVAQAHALLDEAEIALRRPALTLEVIAANREAPPFELPPEHRFEGYDTTEIPIRPGETKFEELADAAAWALTAVDAWAFRLTHEKAEFIDHASSPTSFIYPLATSGSDATVALFSDWGTGYYHSQYIAKHIGRMAPGQAIHLGDVYYVGKQEEFTERFIPILQKYVTASIPLFTLNANHEMDTHGLAYFAYLREKRNGGNSIHPQEGSYFCLTSDRYQIIGIDTAFEKNGRLMNGSQKNWLEARLAEGKSAGKINILLSQNEPFEKNAQKLITKDLATLAANRMIDLWFWGDQHYCALYPPGPCTPFGGSCIGHGGYPYRVKDDSDFESHLVKPLFSERETRFPAELDLRTKLGNNGFCMLKLAVAELEIRYIDWRNRERFRLTLPVEGSHLRWPAESA